MRFGLALTLMHDGCFAHEIGDTWHGNDWWYDERDFNLGYPVGEAVFIGTSSADATNRVANGSFETAIEAEWSVWANADTGSARGWELERERHL